MPIILRTNSRVRKGSFLLCSHKDNYMKLKEFLTEVEAKSSYKKVKLDYKELMV